MIGTPFFQTRNNAAILSMTALTVAIHSLKIKAWDVRDNFQIIFWDLIY
jgi:hypothetical protein